MDASSKTIVPAKHPAIKPNVFDEGASSGTMSSNANVSVKIQIEITVIM